MKVGTRPAGNEHLQTVCAQALELIRAGKEREALALLEKESENNPLIKDFLDTEKRGEKINHTFKAIAR